MTATSTATPIPTSIMDPLFATWCVSVDLLDQVEGHDELASWVREEAAASETQGSYSNVGGWHSPPLRSPEVHPTIEQITAIAGGYAEGLQRRATGLSPTAIESTVWLNRNEPGDYNLTHSHRSTWSFVYYIAVPAVEGQDPRAGALELLDPRPAASCVPMASVGRRFFRPRVGRLIVFPGWIMHSVHPFVGHGDRISLAGDLLMHGEGSATRSPPLQRLQLELINWLGEASPTPPRHIPPRLHTVLRELQATSRPDEVVTVLGAVDRMFEQLFNCELPLVEQELPSDPALFTVTLGEVTE